MSAQGFGKKHHKGKKKKAAAGHGYFSPWVKRFWLGFFSLVMMVSVVVLGGLAYLAKDLPDINKLKAFEKAPGIRVYAANGKMVASYGQVVGESLTYEQFPKELVAAVLATEDRRFFDHIGLDPVGLIRASFRNVLAGGIVQGGSTITQQLAKNVFLTMERTFARKFQEVLLAIWIENHFSKKQILELYLNRVYLGAGNYGVDAASHHYFGKSARELNLQESALLAGLLKAPSRYAPTRSREAAEKRTKQVLLNMQDAGMITEQEVSLAISHMDKALPLARTAGGSHRYFTDWVVDQLPEYIGRVDGDLEVLTTLQPSLQSLADAAIRKWMEAEGNSKKASQAAMVVMQPDGAIQAIIGGRNYAESQYNRATQAKRQPGSAFKLLVYLAALEAGYTPETLVSDRPITIGNWSPKNYTEDYRGDIPLKEGFYRSINTVAAMITHRVGAARVVEMARRLGIKSKLTATPSIALGTNDVSLLEMTTAYADIAAGGKALRPFVIQEIRNKQGKLLYRHPNSGIEQVIATSTVRQMNELLMSVVHSGTARKAMIGRPVAGKTGTTQDYRDAWFMGFTPQLVAGVWVGNDNYTPMQKVTGGGIPTQIWADFMKSALVGKPALPIPTNIVYDGTAAVPMQSGDPSQPVPEGTDIGEALPPTSPDAPAESELIPTEEIPQNEGEGVFDWYEKHQQQGQQPKEEPVEDDGTLLDSLYDKIQSGEVEYSYPNDRERRR